MYDGLVEIKRKSGLDFDDAYQCKIAKEHDLKVVTMDTDFEEINDLDVIFL
ncbi:MAG: PIN domain-containing protein [Euryarchaeota archaeon]|nr:PIN domain-containing protein [Euryarchaeota archaeon]MBU4140060.1 PIN domain-containing protein [Euryarchaeota archaeon]